MTCRWRAGAAAVLALVAGPAALAEVLPGVAAEEGAPAAAGRPPVDAREVPPAPAGTSAPGAEAARPYKREAGPHGVEVLRLDWRDARRDRVVPVKVYAPAGAEGPRPVVLYSHGLGGTREGYEYLGRHWASHGYLCVHLQHPGSDDEAWRGSRTPLEDMRRAAADPRNALDRPLDVRFALDRLAALNAEEGPLRGRADLARAGVAGHSFGAYTTLAAAGQTFAAAFGGGGGGPALADPRLRAAIPMSAPAPRRRDRLDAVYANVRIPCLHMTGTKDDSPIGETRPEDRRTAFDHIRGADQYLVIFRDGDHMVFSGYRRPGGGGGGKDATFHDLIRQATTAFWDAYLAGDAEAKKWLAEGGFEAVLDGEGTFEKRPGGASGGSRTSGGGGVSGGDGARGAVPPKGGA